jgi:hypothetical protein
LDISSVEELKGEDNDKKITNFSADRNGSGNHL